MSQEKKAKPKGKSKPKAKSRRKAQSDSDYDDSGGEDMVVDDDESKNLRAKSKMYNISRQLLQFFVAKGVAPETEVQTFFQQLEAAGYSSHGDNLDGVLTAINDNLRFMRLELKRIRAEHDGRFYWVLANNVSDEVAKNATKLSETEVLFYKLILDHMLQNDGKISIQKAQSLASELPQAKKLNRDGILNCFRSLVNQHWLLPDKNEQRFAIGVRAYADLQAYLNAKAAENWTVNCSVCKQPCYLGVKCIEEQKESSKDCRCKMHFACKDRLFEKQEPACPDCKAKWRRENEGESREQKS